MKVGISGRPLNNDKLYDGGYMRKFIVRNYALGHKVRGLWIPRSMKLVLSYFLVGGLIIAADPKNILQWFDWLIIVGFLVQLYLAGIFPVFSYFGHFPVEWEELDEEQKFLYGKANIRNLTEAQYKEWDIIVDKY